MEFLFMSPEDMPPPIRKMLDMHSMAAEDARNRLQSFLEELSAEQLIILRGIFNDLAQDDSGRHAAYLEGVVTTILKFKHNVCPNCGVNHDEKLLRDAQEAVQKAQENVAPQSETMERLEEQFKEYNVSPIDPSKPLGPVICKGCGTTNPSLEDRMLRQPGVEGCGGCQNKAKFG